MLIGAVKNWDDSLGGQWRTVAAGVGSRWVHPQYDPYTFEYDVMLVRLTEEVVLAKGEAEIVELNSRDNTPQTGDELIIVGMGAVNSALTQYPGFLQWTKVLSLTTQYCNNIYGDVNGAVHLCAGLKDGGRDACAGDSGGPIVTTDGVQVGVTSYGGTCGKARTPTVYTRISGTYNVIRRAICDLSITEPAYCDSIPDRFVKNQPPVIMGNSLRRKSVARGRTATFTIRAEDKDSQQLTMSLVHNGGGAFRLQVTGSGKLAKLTFDGRSKRMGKEYYAEVIVSDGIGANLVTARVTVLPTRKRKKRKRRKWKRKKTRKNNGK